MTNSVFPVLVDGLALTLSLKSETYDSFLTSPPFPMKTKKDLSVISIIYISNSYFFSRFSVSTLIFHLTFCSRLQKVPQTLVLTLYKSNFPIDTQGSFLKDKYVPANNV